MADKKISALPAATTPLAGTEVLPVVQGGVTDKVSVANFTAGRAVSALSLSTTAGIVDVRADNGLGIRFLETTTGNSNRIQLGTGSGFGYIDATVGVGSTYLSLQAGSVEHAKLDTSGNLTVNTGNLVVGTAGKGIDFSANSHAAGMTSELLNDYEEGNWTPTAVSSSGAITSYTSSGNYTKIGNRVFFSLQVTLTDNGTGTGVIDISLPYTAGAVSAGAGQNANSLWGLNGSIAVSGTSMRVARADGTYPGATGQTLRMSGAFIV